jgi:hypothetical protein
LAGIVSDLEAWMTKETDQIKVGDELLVDGSWTMVTAVGRLEYDPSGRSRTPGQRLFFGAHWIFYPSYTQIMVKEK